MAQINLPKPRKASPEQVRFIENLSVDLGFNRDRRNAEVSDITNRDIHYLDELTMNEASEVIQAFEAMK